MQGELDAEDDTNLDIQILSINDINTGTAYAEYCSAATLPYLQTDASNDAYDTWNAAKDDFFIVDESGNIIEKVQLGSGYNLTITAEYNTVKLLLKNAANGT